MPAKLINTNEEVIQAYKETGSVWKAGKRLGVGGQSIWERLKRLNHPMSIVFWTKEEEGELKRLVESGCNISDISKRLARSYGSIAARISSLGLRVKFTRRRKLERGILNKKQTQKLIKKLSVDNNIGFTKFCKQNSLKVDSVALAIQKYDMDFWKKYSFENSSIPIKECAYCEEDFYPMNTKQKTCTRKCQADLRSDKQYFNGNRKNAIGLMEGICQVCGKEGKRGLTPHHVFGKENDPEAVCLVALCKGCHFIIETLCNRVKATEEEFWENLINLVLAKRYAKERKYVGVLTNVDIDLLDEVLDYPIERFDIKDTVVDLFPLEVFPNNNPEAK